MPTYRVVVEQEGYRSGVVERRAATEEDAITDVNEDIDLGTLKPGMIDWSDFVAEEGDSFHTTGDVE